MLETIVVPLDESRLARRALPAAARLAQRVGADVHLVSAVASPDDIAPRQADLEAIELPVPVHVTVLVDDDPARAICEILDRLDNAVTCMATRGRGRSAAILGSVAHAVVTCTGEPVVLTGPSFDEHLHGTDVATCLDEHPASALVMPAALRWARLLRERLVVITVAEPVPPEVHVGPVHRSFGPDGDVDAYLHALIRRFCRQDDDVVARPIYDVLGPVAGLTTYLTRRPASLVALNSKHRGRATRVAFGTTAAAIVRWSPLPILAVPPMKGASP